MMIIGVDYHPGFQQIAFLVEETGECGERRLNHSDGEAENFYRDLKARGISVRVGMETTGFSRWFERLLAELGFEVWIGDAAEIKTRRAKKQKTDRLDAELLLKLLLEDRFPRIWVPSPEISNEAGRCQEVCSSFFCLFESFALLHRAHPCAHAGALFP